MDPVSHSLFGVTVVAAAFRQPRRGLAVVAGAASLVPDVDIAVAPTGWDRYLVVHEIGTHSMAGAVVLAALVAAIATWWRPALGRWRAFLAALVGTAGHVFWDVADGGDIRVLWPFHPVRVGGHLLAMADPLLLVTVVFSLVLMVAARRHAPRIAGVTLLVLAGVLCGKAVLQHRAWRAYESAAGVSGAAWPRAIEANWGTLAQWTIYDRDEQVVRAWRVDSLAGTAALAWTMPVAPVSPLVTLSLDLSTVTHARGLFDLAFPRIIIIGARQEVLWSDPRLCDGQVCGLWFGGRYTGDGVLERQVVRIGTIEQVRSPSEGQTP